jgi:hypothetical protein
VLLFLFLLMLVALMLYAVAAIGRRRVASFLRAFYFGMKGSSSLLPSLSLSVLLMMVTIDLLLLLMMLMLLFLLLLLIERNSLSDRRWRVATYRWNNSFLRLGRALSSLFL